MSENTPDHSGVTSRLSKDKRPRSYWRLATGLLLCVPLFAWIVHDPTIDGTGIFLCFVLACFIPALLIVREIMDEVQARQPTAAMLLAKDPRKPILYLRPFLSDEASIMTQIAARSQRAGTPTRLEILILAPLKDLGPVIAIGRPEEDLPPLGGAARLYVGDDWKEVFSELLGKARLTVLFAGTTENFRWEIEKVFHQEPFVPTILILQLSSGAAFRQIFEAASGVHLPENLVSTKIVYFPERNQLVPITDTNDLPEKNMNVLNPYLGALTRVMDRIEPGSGVPHIRQAQGMASFMRWQPILLLLTTLCFVFARGCYR